MFGDNQYFNNESIVEYLVETDDFDGAVKYFKDKGIPESELEKCIAEAKDIKGGNINE